MRIISGKHKGRKLHPPANTPARPTTDFAKTALFNIINNRFNIDELSVLDLYAGTGAIGLEFLSRGAINVVFVEKDKGSCRFIEKTLMELSMEAVVLNIDVDRYFNQSGNYSFDIIFADPPYAHCNPQHLKHEIDKKNLINAGGLLVIEHAKDLIATTEALGAEVRSYGGSVFSIFEY